MIPRDVHRHTQKQMNKTHKTQRYRRYFLIIFYSVVALNQAKALAQYLNFTRCCFSAVVFETQTDNY